MNLNTFHILFGAFKCKLFCLSRTIKEICLEKNYIKPNITLFVALLNTALICGSHEVTLLKSLVPVLHSGVFLCTAKCRHLRSFTLCDPEIEAVNTMKPRQPQESWAKVSILTQDQAGQMWV